MRKRNPKTQQYQTDALTGQKFGMLTVIEPTSDRYYGSIVWRCRCDCGNEVLRGGSQLKADVKLSCGCEKPSKIRDDLTGRRFGILTALYPTRERDIHQSVIWHCKCDCGREIDLSCADLVSNNYISCGCLKRKAEEQLKDQVTRVAGTTIELLKSNKARLDSTTGVRGVNRMKNKYQAKIHFQGKTYCLGTYHTIEEAAAVRKEAGESLYGNFLDFYDRWKEKADSDPEWGKENPVSVNVDKDTAGRFHAYMLPDLR